MVESVKSSGVAVADGIATLRTLEARIVRNQSTAAKAPVYRVLVTLPGVLGLLTLSFPVFAEKNGKNASDITGFSVAMPGGSFPAVEPIKAHIEKDKRKYWLADPDNEAQDLASKLIDKVKAAAMAYHVAYQADPKAALSDTTITL